MEVKILPRRNREESNTRGDSLGKDEMRLLESPDGGGGEVLPQLDILGLVQRPQQLLGQLDEAQRP